MTQQEFFAYTQLHPNRVNIWYSDQGAPYTLYAMTVPVLDATSPVDNTNLLEAVQQISIPLSTGDIITLNIASRSRIQTPGTSTVPVTTYYYFSIVPLVLQSFGNTAITVDQLQFSPSLNVYELNASPYNALKGNLQGSRLSEYIMLADRYKVGTPTDPTYTGPLNINQLLSGSATKADIQDSNYSNTGWLNGRYIGSKTSNATYGSEPAISGRFFQGSEFPAGSTSSEVAYLVSSNQVIYKDLFYAGVGDTPGFQTQYSNYLVDPSSTVIDINSQQSIVIIIPDSNTPAARAPRPGEFYRQIGSTEIFKVDTLGTVVGNINSYALYVTRGYYGGIQSINSGIGLEKITQVQVYNTDKNKLAGVPKGQIYVKETTALLRLDALGFVVSSSNLVDF